MSVSINSSEWDRMLTRIGDKLAAPAKLLHAVMVTRGFAFIIKKFTQERGPNGPWPKRSASTNKAYESIRNSAKAFKKASKKLGVAGALSAGFKTPSLLVNGVPRSSYRASNRLLQLTGNLRKSLMPGKLASKSRFIGRDAILIFSPIEYSGQHDNGDASQNIPERKFMWLDASEKETIAGDVLKLALMGLR
jgi:phage gpG-like protein